MTLDKQIILMEELLSDDDHWSSKKAKSEYKQLLKWLKDYKRLLEMPKGEYVDISKLRLMTVEEGAGHTIEYAMGWKACIEWLKKGGIE